MDQRGNLYKTANEFQINEFGSIALSQALALPTDVSGAKYNLLEYIIDNGNNPITATSYFNTKDFNVVDYYGNEFTQFYNATDHLFNFPSIAPYGWTVRIILEGTYDGGNGVNKQSVISYEIPAFGNDDPEPIGTQNDIFIASGIEHDPTYTHVTRNSGFGNLIQSGLEISFSTSHILNVNRITWLIG